MLTHCKKFLLTDIVLLVVFTTAVILSCLIPSSYLKKNVGETLNTFKKEGIYPSYGLHSALMKEIYRLDNLS